MYLWFGLPSKIITDQDPQFTSHFGCALTQELGMTWNLLTAFHPQTNRLAEWANQRLEQLLRLSATNQNEWVDILLLLTLIYNNSKNSATGYSPNQLLIGQDLEITPAIASGSDNPTAKS
jgi:hypothetical protein